MATRSFIAIRNDDSEYETYDAVYCHYDGYFDGVGKTLFDHYKTKELVRELIEGGAMSSLEPSFEATVFYTKRGEKLDVKRNIHGLKMLEQAADRAGAEYLYVFVDGEWTQKKLY
jgi:hypothetical protein